MLCKCSGLSPHDIRLVKAMPTFQDVDAGWSACAGCDCRNGQSLLHLPLLLPDLTSSLPTNHSQSASSPAVRIVENTRLSSGDFRVPSLRPASFHLLRLALRFCYPLSPTALTRRHTDQNSIRQPWPDPIITERFMWVGLPVIRGARRLLARPQPRFRLVLRLLVRLGRLLWVCSRLLLTLIAWRIIITITQLLLVVQWVIIQVQIGWVCLKILKCQFFIRRAQWKLQRAHKKESEARERAMHGHRAIGEGRTLAPSCESRRHSVDSPAALR